MRLAICSMLLSVALGTQAQAEDITLDGLVRSAGLFHLVGQDCTRTLKLDVKRAHDYEAAFMETAVKSFGQKAAENALKAELKRRQEEVQATGTRQWCQHQRGYLQGMGVKDVFEN
jgi:hypothetical protein